MSLNVVSTQPSWEQRQEALRTLFCDKEVAQVIIVYTDKSKITYVPAK